MKRRLIENPGEYMLIPPRQVPSWIMSQLSPEQQIPLLRMIDDACILASAGSGKTRTLVYLLAADLAAGIPPSGIIAFTFTEKAADELTSRIYALCKEHLPGLNLTDMYIGTIHGWCFQYLTAQREFRIFIPLDELHIDSLVSRLYDDLQLEKAYGRPYPKAIVKFLADLELFYNEHLTIDQVPSAIRSSIAAFLDILKKNRLLSYGGMIRFATEHLQRNGPLKGLRSLYVDEYQDVNPAQVALIKSMLPEGGRVVVVGDDLQCIYNWRGSDVTRILNFSSEFPKAGVYRLSTNYRARPSIVQFANHIAEQITIRDPKKVMVSGREETTVPSVQWISLSSEQDQAKVIVEIVSRFAENGVPWSKIAILLRSVVRWGRPIVEALTRHNIPVNCPILNRGGPFIDSFLIPVIDWLRQDHREPRNKKEEEEAEHKAKQLWDCVKTWLPEGQDAENMFWDALNEWMKAIVEERSTAYNVRGQLYDFLNKCRIKVTPQDYNLMVGLGIASQIIRSVEEIHRRRLDDQQRRSPRGIMSEIYYALLRNKQDFGESVPLDTSVEGVLITTIHQAKGLEWPIVIIPMLLERCFPVTPRKHATSFPDEVAQRYGTTLNDEWRLFYVAATRARERLFLLDPARGNETSRSEFLRKLQDRGVISVTDLEAIPQEVWRIGEADLGGSEAPPLRVGLSDLLLYVECPYQYALRRKANIEPAVGDELGFGKGLHELIRLRIEAKTGWSDKELHEYANNHVFLPYMSNEGEAQARRVIKEHLKKLEDLSVFDVRLESEVPVEIAFEGGVVHGIIDGIEVLDDGSVRVRDWKSNIHESFLPRYERQLQFYAYALRLQGKNVREADIVDVAASAAQRKLILRPVNISDEAVNQTMQELEKALVSIGANQFHAKPGPTTCSACDMYSICSERYDYGVAVKR